MSIIDFIKKRFGLRFRNLPCCTDRWYLEFYLFIRCSLFGEVMITCPYCKKTKKYVLVSHFVNENTDSEHKINEKIIERGVKNVYKNP